MTPLPIENQAQNLRIAFENGRLPRDLYAKNLLRVLELEHHETAKRLAAAFILGRIDHHLLERNLATLRPAPPPPPDDGSSIRARP